MLMKKTYSIRNDIRGQRSPGGWLTQRIHYSTGVANSVPAGGNRRLTCSGLSEIRGSSYAALMRYPRLVICFKALVVILERG